MFEWMVQAMCGGTLWDESVCVGALDKSIRKPPPLRWWSEGETSSPTEEVGDYDSHHKRAKLDSISHDVQYTMAMSSGVGNSSSSAGRDYSRNQGNVAYTSETFFHQIMVVRRIYLILEVGKMMKTMVAVQKLKILKFIWILQMTSCIWSSLSWTISIFAKLQ